MLLCSLINLYDLRLGDFSNVSLVSMIFSFPLLTVLPFGLFLIFKVTIKGNIENTKYDVLTEDIKKSSFLYRPLYLLRLTLTLVTILTMREYPALQILLLILLSSIH